MTVTPEVLEREREFYNESHGAYRRWRLLIWRAIGAFNRNAEITNLYDPRGKRILLYGCGPANEARDLLEAGAVSISGIDISDVEIADAWRNAREGGYEDKVDFVSVMRTRPGSPRTRSTSSSGSRSSITSTSAGRWWRSAGSLPPGDVPCFWSRWPTTPSCGWAGC